MNYKAAQQQWGTGSAVQQGIQAATAAVQGLAAGNMQAAIAGGAAPYMAEVIHNMTTYAQGHVNVEANLMAHAVFTRSAYLNLRRVRNNPQRFFRYHRAVAGNIFIHK